MSRSNSEDGVPRPDEFPIGSPESRAAARAMLEARESGVRRRQIIIDLRRPRGEPSDAITRWHAQHHRLRSGFESTSP